MTSLEEIARRREILIMRAATQRSIIEDAIKQIQKPLGLVNLGVALINYIKARPIISIGLATTFLVVRPKRFFSWGRKAWLA